ncbi:MAG: DegT/DnrJ/EryC1/StrS family aminotransferase [Solirubrobacterales bacterium]|nr:DegT/DnrJ/EryC1/StrS family aminotransferase [Solirubrobacterales bacterium]MBV9365194.1 DegT/DnrJ/EryC1/StrS family aminotransferase [Solirubrobacterales bacterium]
MEAPAVGARRGGTVRFVALDLQHAHIERELKEAFSRLLGSSAFTLGAEVEQFEAEFAAYSQTRHCVGVASGTAALSLMLEAYGIGPGDEVIVPAHTFIASALAVSHVGATPVLCDVHQGTGLIDPDAARAATGPRTAAILPVHLYGQACDMDAIRAFAGLHGLLVLEDAAQAHGARYHGRRTGGLGDAAAFSFYPSKNLGALGDGGAICTDDDVLASRIRRLRNLGQRAKGEHVELGYNERLDGLQAALLRVKLGHLDEWNSARQAHAALYRQLLEPDVRLVEEQPESPSVHHLLPARFEDRDAVARMLGARGIETGVHYSPAVQAHPAWKNGQLRHGEVPHADAWAAEELSLPMHPDLLPHEIERVAEAVHAAVSVPTARSGVNRC